MCATLLGGAVLGLTSSSGMEAVHRWEEAGAVDWGLEDACALPIACLTASFLMVDGLLRDFRLQQGRRWNGCSN